MTPELWQRLKPLYSAALDLPKEGRSEYVEQICGQDPELAREILALLAADDGAGNTLDPPFRDISLYARSRPAILPGGTVLAGRFRIVRHLGSGGMGDVYEAVDLQMGQGRIALKTVRPAIADDPAALARFKDEVRLARQITGTHVCRIHELYVVDRTPDSHCAAFLTMELLEGITLHDRIEQSSPLPVAEMCSIAEQLCDALGCIHESGIIHRDLKPRNVMLVPHNGSEKVVVMDFGLARAADPAPNASATTLARPGLIVGTPSYMAPEQFEGGEVTQATDIYALGLLLYELATGIQPFAAHTPLAAAVRRARRPQNPSTMRADLPPGWDEVITRCLQYDPTSRFQSAAEVSTALRHPRTVVWHLGKDHRLNISRRLLAAICITALLLLAVGIGLFVRNAQQRRLSPEAAYWDGLGMAALREGSYLKATKLLTMVTERDPKYPVAHAALADAWTELDFTDTAQREMLLASAPSEQYGLAELDRRYIDAVRNTLVRDYSAAAQDYEAILKRDPNNRKADGYVDLGRIYEKAGKVHETVTSYEKAAKLNPDDPAPFLHLGILHSQLRETAAASKAFDRAEELYRVESNLEGLAEVKYQEGYAANETGALAKAEGYLQQSLVLARQIPSQQLEARTLSQLSSVAYWDDRDDQAIAYANQAIDIAHNSGLEYWSTDGLVRLANAYLDKEDLPAAEAQAQEALRLAKLNGHPRLQAAAELTLASLRDVQKRWDESIALAQSALKYYQDYGFLDAADKAETLILRVQRARGNYIQALAAGRQLIDIARRTHSTMSVAIAEELVGGVLLHLERYPEALQLFQDALLATESLGHNPAYQQNHCADALWHLGRYSEAEAALAAIPAESLKRQDIGSTAAVHRIEIQASQGDARGALQLARDAQVRFATMRDDPDLYRTIVSADLQLEKVDAARTDLARLVALEQPGTPPADLAEDRLLQARIALQTGDPALARSLAEGAASVFEANDMQESAALSFFWAATAAQKLGDSAAVSALSQKSVDIFRRLSQSWGVPAFQTYLKRPDRQQIVRTLAQLHGSHGEVPDELFQ